MIPPHLSHQIYVSFFQQNYCTPPKCGKLSEYTDSAHTEVEDPSSRCTNASADYDRCRHDTIQLHHSCTAWVLMIAQISAVNMDAESGNLMNIMVFDGKNYSTSHRIPIP